MLIHHLECSLVGQRQAISLVPGSRIATIYGQQEVEENFLCNYGFNPTFAPAFANQDLRFVGFDGEGALRAIELPGHRFYLATLFLPQMRSQFGAPHPLIVAYLNAANYTRVRN